jgi:hypothetical protein
VHSRRLLFGGILPAAVLVFAGCGSSATAAPTATPATTPAPGAASNNPLPSFVLPSFALPSGLAGSVDPTTLLSADAASSLLGGTATLLPGGITTGPVSTISYATASGDNVSLLVESFPGGIAASVMQASLQAAFTAKGSTSMEPISGLGDVAGKSVSDHEATVAFIKNGTLILITDTSTTQAGSDMEPKLESLAQQIVGKF